MATGVSGLEYDPTFPQPARFDLRPCRCVPHSGGFMEERGAWTWRPADPATFAAAHNTGRTAEQTSSFLRSRDSGSGCRVGVFARKRGILRGSVIPMTAARSSAWKWKVCFRPGHGDHCFRGLYARARISHRTHLSSNLQHAARLLSMMARPRSPARPPLPSRTTGLRSLAVRA